MLTLAFRPASTKIEIMFMELFLSCFAYRRKELVTKKASLRRRLWIKGVQAR